MAIRNWAGGAFAMMVSPVHLQGCNMKDCADWLGKYIDKRKKLRSDQHRAFSIDLMTQYPGYDCAVCIHGLSMSCTDHLFNACEYFCDVVTNRRFKLKPKTIKKLFKKFIK